MRRLKILIVIESLDIGGAEGQVYELVKGLDKNRFDPVVCSLVYRGAYIEKIRQAGVRVVPISSQIRHVPMCVYELIKLIRQEKFDLVHNFMFPSALLGTLAAKFVKSPLVVNSIRSMGFLKHKIRKPIKRVLYFFSDRVIANSNLLKKTLGHCHIACSEKIDVIYNGVDTERFFPHSAVISVSENNRAIDLPEDDIPVIGMIANLNLVKNHQCLLHAIPIILEEFPKAIFLLVGQGPLKKELEILAESLEIRHSVFFLGKREDVPAILPLMDLSVLCSLREGFPNVILESMASATPVVASNVGGNSEAVLDGVTGLLFEPNTPQMLAENVTKLLKNKALRGQMAVASRKRVEECFSIQRMVSEHEHLYESLVPGKG